MTWYPKECFSAREDVTRAAKAEYNRKRNQFYKKCEELFPDFWSLPFRERMEIKKLVEEEMQ